MSKIEWTRTRSDEWSGVADGFSYIQRRFETPSEYQNIHDARVASIALANGYVKLEPGQVVVDIADAETLTEFLTSFCPPTHVSQACNRITDAIMEARDE